jgi:hypothetical protein
MAVTRAGTGFRVSFPPETRRDFLLETAQNFRAYVHWFSFCGPEVERITINALDGHLPSIAKFAPSARPGAHVLIPDAHIYLARGFAHARRASEAAPHWQDRSERIVWRGTNNGLGRMSFDPADQDDITVAQRYRMIMKLRGVENTDVKFSQMHGGGIASSWTGAGRLAGFLAESLPERAWANNKYALDVDGAVNTWSNLLVRMHLGCCVLKIGSQFGFRQWYYDRLKPWDHYVPVEADMRDLVEKVDWVRSHDEEAMAIAVNGQAFARTLDFQSVRREAVDIITANWNRPRA